MSGDMKLLFWNVQGFGNATPGLKNMIIEGVIAEAFLAGAELALLCEIRADSTIGNVDLSKQLTRAVRGAVKQAAQLGYGAIKRDLTNPELKKCDIPNFEEVFPNVPENGGIKGGGNYQTQSRRHVGFAGKLGTANVYVHHCNASDKASGLVPWLVEALRQKHHPHDNFLLVGDLNCEPTAVMNNLHYNYKHQFFGGGDGSEDGLRGAAMIKGFVNLNFIPKDGGRTINAKGDLNRTYDYAIAGFGVDVKVEVLDIRDMFNPQLAVFSRMRPLLDTLDFRTEALNAMPDHLPILVSFP
jgi:hypothetical protein